MSGYKAVGMAVHAVIEAHHTQAAPAPSPASASVLMSVVEERKVSDEAGATTGYTVQARPTYEVIEGESDNDYTVVLKQVVRYHPLPGHQGIRILRMWGPGERIEAERIAVALTDLVRARERDTEARGDDKRAGVMQPANTSKEPVR